MLAKQVHVTFIYRQLCVNNLPIKLFSLMSCMVRGRVKTSGALGMFIGNLMNLLCSSGTSEIKH